MQTSLKMLGGALLALGLAQGAVAVEIYANGLPNGVSGTAMTEFQVAENFALGTAYDLTNLRFWSIQSAPADYSGSVYWAVYADASGQPGSLVAGGITAAVAATPTGGSTGFGYGIYAFDVPVSFTLAAGSYWLGLHNGALSNTSPTEMLWATTSVQVGSFGLYQDGSWVNSGNEHAFAIDGNVAVVPEPASALMLLAGLLGTLAAARRRVG